MASQNNSTADPRLLLPNPFTPLAFVPPENAYTVAIAAFVLIGTLSICMWDGLHCLSQDYVLLFKQKIGIPTITYFLSRICTFGFNLTASIFETAPIKHCAMFRIVTNGFYLTSIPMTSLLFFLRLRAVYNRNKYVSGIFFTLWLAVTGYCLSLVTSIKGVNIGPTDYCADSPFHIRDGGTGIGIFIHDTLVFLAISWRLFYISHLDNDAPSGLKAIVLGRYLPAFSRAILQDGQMYYLMSLATVVLSQALFYSSHLPTQMRAVFSAFTITITNIMASRVFRNVKLGLYLEQGDTFPSLNTTALSTLHCRTGGRPTASVPLPLSQGKEEANCNGNLGFSIEGDMRKKGPVVHIVKTTDYHANTSHTDVQSTDSGMSKRDGSLV